MSHADYIADQVTRLFEYYGKNPYKSPHLKATVLAPWVRELSEFDERILRLAFKKWKETKDEPPTLSVMLKKCKSLAEWLENKERQANPPRCQYQDPKECDASKALCSKFAITDPGYGPCRGICPWHLDVAYAKAFPSSGRVKFVADMIEQQRMGINAMIAEDLEGLPKEDISLDLMVKKAAIIKSIKSEGCRSHVLAATERKVPSDDTKSIDNENER